jgi:hypothetical protein
VTSEAVACARRCRLSQITGWWTQKELSEKMDGRGGGGEAQGVAAPPPPTTTGTKTPTFMYLHGMIVYNFMRKNYTCCKSTFLFACARAHEDRYEDTRMYVHWCRYVHTYAWQHISFRKPLRKLPNYRNEHSSAYKDFFSKGSLPLCVHPGKPQCDFDFLEQNFGHNHTTMGFIRYVYVNFLKDCVNIVF